MKKTFLTLAVISIGAATLSACSGSVFSPSAGAQASTGVMQPTQTTLENQQMKQAGVTEASALSSPPSGGAVGGHLGGRMDVVDRGRMLKALDSPIGKTVSWTNNMSRITYTLTPTQKVVINENPFCRRYHLTAQSSGNQQDFDGTACISSDGNWHSVR